MVKPLRSTKKQIRESLKSSSYFIKYSLDKKARDAMQNIINKVKKGYSSKKKYSKNGVYTNTRKRIHEKIMYSFLRKDKKTNSPDVYVFGGPAGSGKTSVLAKMVKEKVVTINNDDIKAKLAKIDKSPIEKYPLLHAAYLHDESQDIESELLDRAIRQRKDIILDRTLANYKKNRRILSNTKNKGYKVTVLGTNLPPHIALIRASSRFLAKGRYVPLELVAAKGNTINASVLRMAKQRFVNKARVYDTTKRKPELIYKKGR